MFRFNVQLNFLVNDSLDRCVVFCGLFFTLYTHNSSIAYDVIWVSRDIIFWLVNFDRTIFFFLFFFFSTKFRMRHCLYAQIQINSFFCNICWIGLQYLLRLKVSLTWWNMPRIFVLKQSFAKWVNIDFYLRNAVIDGRLFLFFF